MAKRSTPNEPVPPERQVFAANLERLRKAGGHTQAELAEKSGLRSHTDERRANEVEVAVYALNRMPELGCPISVRVA